MRKWRRRQEHQQHRRWLLGLDRYSIGQTLLSLPPWIRTTIVWCFGIVLLLGFYMAIGVFRAYARHKIFAE